MVKLKAPMFSLDASGKLANAIVFSRWKGRHYARSLVTPSNPQSGPQTGMRAMLKFLSQEWDGLATADKSTWLEAAAADSISTFNAYMSYDLKRWRDFNTPTQASPPALVSTTPDGATGVATPDIRSITLAITHGTNLADWGFAIFRSPTGTFNLSFSNCIAVVPCDGSGDAEYIDSPLAADQYFYNYVGFNDDGVEGADGTECDGTVV